MQVNNFCITRLPRKCLLYVSKQGNTCVGIAKQQQNHCCNDEEGMRNTDDDGHEQHLQRRLKKSSQIFLILILIQNHVTVHLHKKY